MKTPLAKVAAGAAASAILTSSIFSPSIPTPNFSMPFRQYSTATDIPLSSIQNKAVISGRVLKVIDGDTIRIRHYPFYPFLESNSFDGPLSQNSISVRIYGVDAPELGKFGNPSMPKAEDARDWTKSFVDGKIVKVKLLRRDQYGRVVGKVTKSRSVPFLPSKDLTLNLARNGYATLYTGGGAEYDGQREKIEKDIEYAKSRKLGIWTNGVDNVMSPAEYKKKMKESR